MYYNFHFRNGHVLPHAGKTVVWSQAISYWLHLGLIIPNNSQSYVGCPINFSNSSIFWLKVPRNWAEIPVSGNSKKKNPIKWRRKKRNMKWRKKQWKKSKLSIEKKNQFKHTRNMNNKTKYSPNAGLERKIYYFTGFEFVTCFKRIICVSQCSSRSRIKKKRQKWIKDEENWVKKNEQWDI